MAEIGRRAREAAAALALASAEAKTEALRAAAESGEYPADDILAANAAISQRPTIRISPPALRDRLALDPKRLEGVAAGLKTIARTPIRSAECSPHWSGPTGLSSQRVSVPLGVIGIIYESRPNVTADAGGLALKSGNAAILRGGSESFHSSRALAAALTMGCAPPACRRPRSSWCRPATALPSGYAENERDHRYHRAARRVVADRAGSAREPDTRHRPSRRAVPHLYSTAPPTRRRRERSCSTPRCAGYRSVARLKHCWSIAPSPTRSCRRSSPIFGLPAASCAAIPKSLAIDPAAAPATEEDWRTEYLDAILAVHVVDGVGERSSISPASARITLTRS